jgi:hypothetical protein
MDPTPGHALRNPFRSPVVSQVCRAAGANLVARAFASGVIAASLAALLGGCGWCA